MPQGDAYLEDVAAFADGLFKLADLTSEARWAEAGQRLGKGMIAAFEDAATGAYFSTSEAHEILFGRTRPAFDQPVPSANALALRVFVAMGETERAQKLVAALLGLMERVPTATEGLYAAALPLLSLAEERPVVAAPPVAPAQPTVSLRSAEVQAGPDGRATFTVVLDLPDDLHVNGPQPPARWLTPTRVAVRPLKAEVAYPEESGIGYVGRVEIPVTVALPSGESGADLEIVVTYQPCTDRECLAPVERVLCAVAFR